MKRRWDDDVVFKNQARGTEDKGKKKEFVNVSLVIPFRKAFSASDSVLYAFLFLFVFPSKTKKHHSLTRAVRISSVPTFIGAS
jgi:uncharacterized membrane protein